MCVDGCLLHTILTPLAWQVTKGKDKISFYSLPEFQEWKQKTNNFATWKVKYYKGELLFHDRCCFMTDIVLTPPPTGLGTSDAKEAKEYFSDMNRHKIKFNHNSAPDDNAITLAFIKKNVDERKEWLTDWMEKGRWRCNGEIAFLGPNKLEITELPVHTWTYSYKEDMEKLMVGDEKSRPAQILDYRDHNTDSTIRMIVQMDAAKLREAEGGKGLQSFFKLQTTMTTTWMVLFDHMGVLRLSRSRRSSRCASITTRSAGAI